MTAPAAAVNRVSENGHEERVYPVPLPSDPAGERVELPNISGVVNVTYKPWLTDWKIRMALLGVANRDDIAMQAVAATHLDAGTARNRELNRVAELAITAGQVVDRGKLANDLGSGAHLLTESIDAGRIPSLMDLPANAREFAASYIERMRGLQIVHSEFTVYNHAVGYAGTGDRIVRFPSVLGEHAAVFDQFDLTRGCFVLDIKTGKVSNDAAMQLAALVNAEGIWDAELHTFEPLPDDLRRDVGFILDLKQGPSRLVPVDLSLAWPAFVGGVAVKKFCASKPLFSPLGPLTPTPPEEGVSPTARGEVDVRGGDDGPSREGEATAPPAPSTFYPNCTLCDTAGHLCPGCGTDVPASSDPTHISEALPAAVAAIPDAPADPDPFAGLPDPDGKPLYDRNVKLAWLRDQYEGLKAMGKRGTDAMGRHWPADTPTLRKAEQTGHQYSYAELDAIEAALKAAVDEAAALWPDVDPTDPAMRRVPNSDARVLALVERGNSLPVDLQAKVAEGAREAKLPNLSHGCLYESHVSTLDAILDRVEGLWLERAQRIVKALGVADSYGLDSDAVLAVFGAGEERDLTPRQAVQLDVLADCICAMPTLFAVRDGRLVVDRPADVADLFPGKRELRDAARAYAQLHGWPAPASADTALADVLIVAHLVAAN